MFFFVGIHSPQANMSRNFQNECKSVSAHGCAWHAHGMRNAASYHHDPGSAVYHCCCALQVCELCQDSEFWKSWSHWQRLVVFSFLSLSETLEIPSPFAATNVQLCKGRCCSPWLFSGGPPLFRIFHVKVSNTVEMTRVISWEYASSFGTARSFKSPSKSAVYHAAP